MSSSAAPLPPMYHGLLPSPGPVTGNAEGLRSGEPGAVAEPGAFGLVGGCCDAGAEVGYHRFLLSPACFSHRYQSPSLLWALWPASMFLQNAPGVTAAEAGLAPVNTTAHPSTEPANAVFHESFMFSLNRPANRFAHETIHQTRKERP